MELNQNNHNTFLFYALLTLMFLGLLLFANNTLAAVGAGLTKGCIILISLLTCGRGGGAFPTAAVGVGKRS